MYTTPSLHIDRSFHLKRTGANVGNFSFNCCIVVRGSTLTETAHPGQAP